MNKICGLLCAAIAVSIGLAVNSSLAQAGVLWTANWIAEKPNIISASGNNQLLLSDEIGFHGDGNQSMTATRITVGEPFSTSSGGTDSFTDQNYALRLTLTDEASNETTDLLFAGDISGTITPDSAALTNDFHSPTSRTVTLGDYEYEVTIGPFTPEGQDGEAGTIYASVRVTPTGDDTPPPSPNEAPEPTSLALAGLGASCAAWAAWRRRRTGK